MRIFPKCLWFLEPIMLYTGAEEAAALAAAEGAAAGGATVGGGAALTAGELAAGSAAGAGGLGAGGLSDIGLSPGTVAAQGASLALKASAAADADARRRAVVDAMTAYQSDIAKKEDANAQKYIDDSSPEARAARMAEAEASVKAGYQKSVGAAQGFQGVGDPAGNLSSQYTAAKAASADSISKRNAALIESLSQMRAPGVAGLAEGVRFGRAASDLAALNSSSGAAGRAGMTDLGNVQESPWLNLGGDVASGVGQGLALKNALANARKTTTAPI